MKPHCSTQHYNSGLSLIQQTCAPKLRIAAIVGSEGASASARHILSEIEHSSYAEIVVIGLVDEGDVPDSAWTHVKGDHGSLLFRCCAWLDYRLFHDRTAKPNSLERQPLVVFRQGIPKLRVGAGNGRPPWEQFRDFQPDLLLDFTGTLPPDAHSVARLGMWSSRPVAKLSRSLFQAMCSDRRLMEVTLPLIRGGSTTEHKWADLALDRMSLFRNYNRYYWSEADALLHALKQMQAGKPPDRVSSRELEYHTPPGWQTALAAFRGLARIVYSALERALFREDWFVAYRKAVPILESSSEPFVIVRAPRGRFFADPFLAERNGRTFLFFEDFAYAESKAVISFVEIDAQGSASKPEPVLDLNYHVSYPCIFEWNGEMYMLPESKDNRTVEVFRALDFPRKWQRESVLMDGVSTVDSTLFAYKNKFWLFTSGMSASESLFAGDENLCLFFSDSPFGPWTPHPKNPIVTDVRNCRSAGNLFFDGGSLLRPAQDCSERYGKLVRLNRVDVLSEEDYAESPFAVLNSNWLPGNLGTHTFDQNASYQAVDGRDRMFRLFPRLSNSVTFKEITVSGPLFQRVTQPQGKLIDFSSFESGCSSEEIRNPSALR